MRTSCRWVLILSGWPRARGARSSTENPCGPYDVWIEKVAGVLSSLGNRLWQVEEGQSERHDQVEPSLTSESRLERFSCQPRHQWNSSEQVPRRTSWVARRSPWRRLSHQIMFNQMSILRSVEQLHLSCHKGIANDIHLNSMSNGIPTLNHVPDQSGPSPVAALAQWLRSPAAWACSHDVGWGDYRGGRWQQRCFRVHSFLAIDAWENIWYWSRVSCEQFRTSFWGQAQIHK